MKHIDEHWVKGLALPHLQFSEIQFQNHAISIHRNFMDALAEKISETVHLFNTYLSPSATSGTCHVFKLAHPRTGLMLLRNKEKLILSMEAKSLKIRKIVIQAFMEKQVDIAQLILVYHPSHGPLWQCTETSQFFTPELLCKFQFGQFIGGLQYSQYFCSKISSPFSDKRAEVNSDTQQMRYPEIR